MNLAPLAALLGAIASIVGALVPILVTLALAVFFWGLVRYLWGEKGVLNHEEGKKLMQWGLVTLFVMVSVWGIIDLAQTALNLDKNAQGKAPQIMYPGTSNTAVPYTGSGGCPLGTPGCYR